MTTVARFIVPSSAFVLGEVLATDSSIEIRLESLVPTARDIIPYFWVQNASAEHVSEALETSPLADSVRLVDRTTNETLFRARWSLSDDPIINALNASEGALLAAWGDDETWTLNVRFDEQHNVSTFYRTCVDGGVTPTLSELHSNSADNSAGLGLTDPQREALKAALDAGYYDVPRETTLQELAESLGISDTALSQRLRRGLTTILSSSSTRLSSADSELLDIEDGHGDQNEDDEQH